MTRPTLARSEPNRPHPPRPNSWRLFHGLRIHLAALVGGLFCAFYLFTGVLIYGLTARLTQDDVDAILRDTTSPLAARVTGALNHGQFPSQFITLAKLSQMYPKVSAIVLRDPLGNVIASTAPTVTRTLPYQSAANTPLFTTVQVPTHGWYRVVTLRLTSSYQQTTGFLQIAMNVDRDRVGLTRLREVLLLVGGIGMMFAATAGFFLSKISLRPAVRAWHLQEQFVADASHELRTPLTVMRLNLEVMNSNPDTTVAQNAQWVQSIEEEVHRLHRLTDQLLMLARTDSGTSAVIQRPVDLLNLVVKVTESFRLHAETKGLALQYRALPDLPAEPHSTDVFTVLGDLDKLYQLLAILVDNAIKYTAEGRVDVHLERRRNEVLLSVRDTGIGIDSPHLERVFDRFYRTDAARAKGSGGTGLGLSIARAITALHLGQISVQSTPGEGTTFVVSLPAAGSGQS